jgi:hypothetical protein
VTAETVLPAVLPSDDVAQREKRSISLPPELAQAIERAAAAEGKTFSAWIADTLHRHLKLEAGRRALAEWECENGPLTPEERARAREELDELLGRTKKKRAAS